MQVRQKINKQIIM